MRFLGTSFSVLFLFVIYKKWETFFYINSTKKRLYFDILKRKQANFLWDWRSKEYGRFGYGKKRKKKNPLYESSLFIYEFSENWTKIVNFNLISCSN